MREEMKKYLDLVKSQVGYSEQVGGYTKYGDWYGKTIEFDADYSAQPWCDMFLSWAARQLGYQDWIGQFAYTPYHAQWFLEHGAWGTTPTVGAFVFYDWGGSKIIDNIDHVGVVTGVDGSLIHTVEGNIDGGHAREKVRDQTYVVGYGYPEKVKARLDAEQAALASTGQAAKGTDALARGHDETIAQTGTRLPLAAGWPGDGAFPAPDAPLLAVPVILAALGLYAGVHFRRLVRLHQAWRRLWRRV